MEGQNNNLIFNTPTPLIDIQQSTMIHLLTYSARFHLSDFIPVPKHNSKKGIKRVYHLRYFSAINFVKNKICNHMRKDEWLNDCLVTYINKYFL